MEENNQIEPKAKSIDNKENLLQNSNDPMKDKLLQENTNGNALSNEEFTEFTYILIKNFESKKISIFGRRKPVIN